MKQWKKISDTEKDPAWPEHTGEEVWKNGAWTLTITRHGGIIARRSIVLRHRKTFVGSHYDLGQIGSLRKWIDEKVTEFEKGTEK